MDILRFDHFRGFAGYYEIPASHTTAENGRWVTGPGKDLFRAVDKYLGDGLITHYTWPGDCGRFGAGDTRCD